MTFSLQWSPMAATGLSARWIPFQAHALPSQSTPRLIHAHAAVRMDVRLIRPLRESGHGRMVLTGRMADVCAALDLMVASQEGPLDIV